MKKSKAKKRQRKAREWWIMINVHGDSVYTGMEIPLKAFCNLVNEGKFPQFLCPKYRVIKVREVLE